MGKLRWVERVLPRVIGSAAGRDAQRDVPRDDRLRTAIANAPIGIALASLDGHWLYFNSAFQTLLGYSQRELQHVTFTGVTHPDDAKRELALVKRLMSGDIASYRIDKRTIDRSGAYRVLHVNTVALRNAREEAESFIYVADTAQVKTQSGNDADRFSAAIIDQLGSIAVIRTSRDGVITGWNTGAQKIFGYAASQVIGKNRRTLYRDADAWADRPESHLSNAESYGRFETNDWRVRSDGVSIYVKSSITAFTPDGTLRGFVEVIAPADEGSQFDQQVIATLRADVERERQAKDAIELEMRELRAASERELRAASERATREMAILDRKVKDEMARRMAAENELTRVVDEHDAFVADGVTPPVATSAPADVVTAELVPMPHDSAPPWKEIEGELLLDLLLVFGEEKRSGIFIATNGEHERAIFFTRGSMTAAASDDPAMFLGERLVADGAITAAQRRRALELVAQTQVAFGRVLLIMSAITPQKLRAALRRKLDAEVKAMVAWEHAQWAFVPREDSAPRKLVPLNVRVQAFRKPEKKRRVARRAAAPRKKATVRRPSRPPVIRGG